VTTVDHTPTVPAAPRRASSVPRGVVGLTAVILLAALFAVVTGLQGRHEVTVVAPADRVAAAAAAVPWSLYLPGFREQLAADSCTDLDEAYRAAQLVDGPVDSRPVEAYIAALAVSKGCVL
jgi:hypothetical protein